MQKDKVMHPLETIPVWKKVNGLWIGKLFYENENDFEFPGNHSNYYSLIYRHASGTKYWQKISFSVRDIEFGVENVHVTVL